MEKKQNKTKIIISDSKPNQGMLHGGKNSCMFNRPICVSMYGLNKYNIWEKYVSDKLYIQGHTKKSYQNTKSDIISTLYLHCLLQMVLGHIKKRSAITRPQFPKLPKVKLIQIA